MGYGAYSLNINSVLNPSIKASSSFFKALKLSKYQYFESFNYLGLGIFLCLLSLIITSLVKISLNKKQILTICLTVLSIYFFYFPLISISDILVLLF